MFFTEKQLRIREFIQQFRDERGISPTLEEIASNFGVTKITVYEHINQLERKGALKREKFRARSIELITSVEERKARYSMPLMGNFREGLPIEATEEREDLNISEMLPYGRNFFALRVCGNDLKQDHLTDGDLIIAEKRESVHNGDVVVAVLNGGKACIKKLYREEGHIRLQSPNGSLESTMVPRADVRGVVVGVLRRFDEASTTV